MTKKLNPIIIVVVVLAVVLFNVKTKEQIVMSTEEKLAHALGQIEGIGQLTVFLYKEQEQQQEMAFFSGLEQREPTISGVLIVCEGAKNIAVQQQLKTIVHQLLQVPMHRIVVEQMNVKEI